MNFQRTFHAACALAACACFAQQPAFRQAVTTRTTAAGELAHRAWQALNGGDRQESHRLAVEAEKLLVRGTGADARAVASLFLRLGFGLRSERTLLAALDRTKGDADAEIQIRGDLLNYYASEQRWLDCFRIGDEMMAAPAGAAGDRTPYMQAAARQLATLAEAAGLQERAGRYTSRIRPENTQAASTGPQAIMAEIGRLQMENKWPEAIALQRKLIAQPDAGPLGGEPWMRISLLQQLALMYSRAGDQDEARRTWLEALALAESRLPPERVSQHKLEYAGWLAWQGNRPDEAAELTASILETSSLPGHVRMQGYSVMASIELHRGKKDEAEKWQRMAAEAQQDPAAADQPKGESVMAHIRRMQEFAKAGRYGDAAAVARDVMSRAPRANDGEGFAATIASVAMMMRGKHPEDSEHLMEELVSAAEAVSSWWALPLEQALAMQTQFFLQSGQTYRARKSANRWQAFMEETRGPTAQAMNQVMQTRAWIEVKDRAPAAARKEVQAWMKHLESTTGAESRAMAGSLLQAAEILVAAGELDSALALAREAQQLSGKLKLDNAQPAAQIERIEKMKAGAKRPQ